MTAPRAHPSDAAPGESRPAWRTTRVLTRLVVSAMLPLVLAVLFGRPVLAVLALPFALTGALALRARPQALPQMRVRLVDEHLIEDSVATAQVSLANPDRANPDRAEMAPPAEPASYDLAVVRCKPTPWVRLRARERVSGVTVPARGERQVAVRARLQRWGQRQLGPMQVQAYACDFCLRSEEVTVPALDLRVFPGSDLFSADDAMPRAAGLVGAHRSRRYGDGGELAGIREFAPGDRLRRIDWRASLRTGDLYVAHTLSDRDAELVLLLDVLHDAKSPDGGQTASVLDTSVHAAAGIARHYLDRGDRIALMEFGSATRRLRAGSGRRHLLAVLQWLLDVQPYTGRIDPASTLPGMSRIPSTALVVVLTPLLDERSAELAARLARSGRAVVAVDTLPEQARPDWTGPWVDLAYRLSLVERRSTIGRLLEHGVPTVAWQGAGSLDQVLRDASRVAASTGGAR